MGDGESLAFLVLAHLVLAGNQIIHLDPAALEVSPSGAAPLGLPGFAAALGRSDGGALPQLLVDLLARATGPRLAALLVGAVAAHLLLLATLLVSREDRATRDGWTRVIAALLLAFVPLLGWCSAMDPGWTLFAAAAFTGIVLFGAAELTLSWAAALALAAAALCRPEGLVLAAACLLWHMMAAAGGGRLGEGRTWLGPLILIVLAAGLGVLATTAGPLGLPAPLRFDQADPGRLLAWLTHLHGYPLVLLVALVLPVVVALVALGGWPVVQAAAGFAALTVGLAVLVPPAAQHPCQRVLGLALLLVLAQEGYAWIVMRMRQTVPGRSSVGTVMAALVLALGLGGFLATGPARAWVAAQLVRLGVGAGESAPGGGTAAPEPSPAPTPAEGLAPGEPGASPPVESPMPSPSPVSTTAAPTPTPPG